MGLSTAVTKFFEESGRGAFVHQSSPRAHLKKFLIILAIMGWVAYGGLARAQLSDAALQMRYRLGEALIQEQQIIQDIGQLQSWLKQARQEEAKLAENLEKLTQIQSELTIRLPAIMEQESAARRRLGELRRSYQAQLRAVYLYAPKAQELVFASEGDFKLAMTMELELRALLAARSFILRQLQDSARALEADLGDLQDRQQQMRELSRSLYLTRQDLDDLSARRGRALRQMEAKDSQLRRARQDLDQARQRLERTAASAIPQIGNSNAPATNAVENKGNFFAPVQGRLLDNGGFSLLEAPAGSQARAPWAGVVAFAGDVPGFGQLIIIDHGQRLHSVLAHLGAIYVQSGQGVSAGQVVGEIDASGLLYLEIRLAAKLQKVKDWIFLG
jgi:septal ring factor EnvC (AmiA/AmiB activator)